MEKFAKLKEWHIILTLTLFTLLLGLVPLFSNILINTDGVWYIWCAMAIEAGDLQAAKDFYPMTFVPRLIVVFHKFIPDWELAAKLLCFTCLTLLTPIFYLLARDIFGTKYAIVSSLFLAASPFIREKTGDVLRDGPFLFFLCCFLWAFNKVLAKKATFYHYFLLLVFAMAMPLCRLEGFLVYPLAFLIVLIKLVLQSRWKVVGILTFVVIILTSVFLFYGESLFPRADVLLQKIKNPKRFYQSMKFIAIVNDLRSYEKTLPGQGAKGNFVQTARRYFWLVYLIGWFHHFIRVAFPTIFILACFGFFKKPEGDDKQNAWVLILFFLYFSMTMYIYLLLQNFLTTRYLIPGALLICFWSGPGFFLVLEKLQKVSLLKKIAPFLLLGITLGIAIGRILILTYRDEDNVRKAGLWIKENINKPTLITNEFRLLYYADIRIKRTNKTTWCILAMDFPPMLKKAREQNVSIIVVRNRFKRFFQLGTHDKLRIFPDKDSEMTILKIEKK